MATRAGVNSLEMTGFDTLGINGWKNLFERELRGLDAKVQPRVLDKDLDAPPVSPTNGAAYIVGPTPTGAWATHAGEIARWDTYNSAWEFWTPKSGWTVFVVDETAYYHFDGTEWQADDTLPYLDLDTDYDDDFTRVGRIVWNKEAKTASLVLENGSTLEFGQESHTPQSKNTSGVDIVDGKVVYIKGASGNSPEVGLANAGTASKSHVIAVSTQPVANNNSGVFTTSGYVRGLNTNTSGWTEGCELFLGIADGEITHIKPDRPNHHISIGYLIRKHATEGSILVAITHYPSVEEISAQDIEQVEDAKSDTGFVDPELIDIAYDSTTRKITLTKSGGIEYWWRGRKKVLASPWVSSAHDVTNAAHFLYSTDGTNFVWSTTPWKFTDLMVADPFYGVSDKFGIRDCHGMSDWNWHENWHMNFGTYLLSGGTLTAGTFALNTDSDAAITPGVDATVIKDEDLVTTLPALAQGTYMGMYPISSTEMEFTSTTTPFTFFATYIRWFNGSTLTDGTAGKFYNVYLIAVPVTSDANSQQYRYLWLQPVAEYSSLALARAEDPQKIDLLDFKAKSAEFCFVRRLVFATSAANSTTGKVQLVSNDTLKIFRGPA